MDMDRIDSFEHTMAELDCLLLTASNAAPSLALSSH